MKQLLKSLTAQSKELIDGGNSREKAQGYGMRSVISAVRLHLNTEQRKKKKALSGFFEHYRPRLNRIVTDGSAPHDGRMYETYGEEIEYVLSFANSKKKSDQRKVWTLIETEGKLYASAGYHLVNRLGYFITQKEWETGTEEFEI